MEDLVLEWISLFNLLLCRRRHCSTDWTQEELFTFADPLISGGVGHIFFSHYGHYKRTHLSLFGGEERYSKGCRIFISNYQKRLRLTFQLEKYNFYTFIAFIDLLIRVESFPLCVALRKYFAQLVILIQNKLLIKRSNIYF